MRYFATITRYWTVLATVALLAAGCADATQSAGNTDRAPASERDDEFLQGIGGKADSAYEIEEGGAKAKALLDFVNTASLTTLDDKVSLDVRAAENIVSARSDGDIDTLSELDAISWVSSRAFDKLYTYCQKNGVFGDSNSTNLVHGIEPGSDTAGAILDTANTETRTTLDNDVGLDTRAAANIVSYRRGQDGTAGTADDRSFDSLGTLDGINWVDGRAFSKLAAFADTGDDGSVPKDSARALGAFHVANNASHKTLDDTIGLDVRAADNIVDHRSQHTGTRNGNKIESIKELDGIAWVGEASIRALADYANATGELPDVFHGIPVGSRRATGILRIANDRSNHELEDSIGLETRAASNIIDYRQGHDGQFGTSDDQTFNDVSQLAGVSYVAQTAFDKLLTEARASGTIPAQTWRDVLPTGRIETRLPRTAVTCNDADVPLDSYTAYSGPDYIKPRVLDEGGYYRMFGDNPGRLSVQFYSEVRNDRFPDQSPMDIAANGTFSGHFDNGGYVWDDINHSGRITRSGRLLVTFYAQLDPFDYTGDAHYCKMELSLPND